MGGHGHTGLKQVIRILLLLALLMLVFWIVHWFQKQQFATIKTWLIKSGWLIAGLALLLLVVSGKLNWLFAMAGVAIAFVIRLLPAILHYAPQLQRLWSLFNSRQDRTTQQQAGDTPQRGSGLSQEEAFAILGLRPGASDEEIIQAHRKLIAKLHPDKGGSSYLAAKINLAKRVLLH